MWSITLINLIIVDSKTLVVDAVRSVKDVLRSHSSRLSQLLQVEPNMREFANRMFQADLISDSVAKAPAEYQSIVSEFLAGLEFCTDKSEIKEEFNKLLGVLEDIGGPFKKASSVLRRDLDQNLF